MCELFHAYHIGCICDTKIDHRHGPVQADCLQSIDEMEQSAKAAKAQKEAKASGHQLDASDDANAKFQGKEVHVIGAGDGKRIVAQGASEEVELYRTPSLSLTLTTRSDQAMRIVPIVAEPRELRL